MAGGLLLAQSLETRFKVYDYDDGLPHRNVFDLLQDQSGYIWMSTVEGVVRFDGYDFYKVDQAGENSVAHLALWENELYCASLDSVVRLNLTDGSTGDLRLKDGEYQRRQSRRPTRLEVAGGLLYVVVQDELSGQIHLERFQANGEREELIHLIGQYPQRPLAAHQDSLYLGAQDDYIFRFDATSGQVVEQLQLPLDNAARTTANRRIIDLRTTANRLWVLLNDGQVISREYGKANWEPLPTQVPIPADYQGWQCMEIGPGGDVYLGGRGELWHYNHYNESWTALDPEIRQLLRNTPIYRRLLLDASGTLWAATDFGAIRVNRLQELFQKYLSGGSEFCSNVYCSTRGLTEDDEGRVYISYYNSIHVLDPATQELKPLFPANDYFNYPFGLHYHDGHLYTGNGLKINLDNLRIESLFGAADDEGEGAVAQSADGTIWFGFRNRLLAYDPKSGEIDQYRGAAGSWADMDNGNIAYILAERGGLWIGTHENGLFELNLDNGRLRHWPAGDGPLNLPGARVNAIHRQGGRLWVGTPAGLAAIDLTTAKVKSYTTEDGLPHTYINGILAEGDSALWISTDYGLSRMVTASETFLNFFNTDGISSNEFNRMSFLKGQDGKLYFGGLDGVNAFFPSQELLDYRSRRINVPLNLTLLSYVDGLTDSMHSLRFNRLESMEELDLSYQNRLFTFDFSLADYREPQDNRYSYWLENFTKDWSEPESEHRLRISDLPPGEYRLHVRGRSGHGEWASDVIDLPIVIRKPYYYNIWFWIALIGLAALVLVGLYLYRAQVAIRRQQELEKEVAQRTAELAAEKEKADQLLLNILPAQTAEELKQTGKALARRHEQVTVCFSDFVGFTAISNNIEPERLVQELDFCFRTFDEIVARYGLEKIKTVGDAYLYVGGLDGDPVEAAKDSLRAARDIQAFLHTYAEECAENNRPIFRARVGLHTGHLVSGVVGTHKFAYDIWGETVNLASRMESHGVVEGIVISEATRAMVGSEFDCRPHGTYEEHGKSVRIWQVH